MSMFISPFEYSRPSRDQRFNLGLDPEYLFSSLIPVLTSAPAGYSRHRNSGALQKASGSTVCCDKDKFQVNLGVEQFKPEEITVKVNNNIIMVEGKHEEQEDEHGFISRHFMRKYVVPEGHHLDKVESKLSSDGVLTITAPRIGNKDEECKSIPVIQTGQPSKAVEKKEEKKIEK